MKTEEEKQQIKESIGGMEYMLRIASGNCPYCSTPLIDAAKIDFVKHGYEPPPDVSEFVGCDECATLFMKNPDGSLLTTSDSYEKTEKNRRKRERKAIKARRKMERARRKRS